MPVLKYRDPITGEIKKVGAPSLGGEGGVDIPASDVAPKEGEWWLDTSEDGETHEYAAKDLSNVPNEDLVAKLEESGFSGGGVQMELLWENASPASEFAAQNILEGIDYDLFLIRCAGDDKECNVFLTKDRPTSANAAYLIEGQSMEYQIFRYFTYSSDSKILSCDAGYVHHRSNNSAVKALNNYVVTPRHIYGIKGIKDKKEVSA